MARAAAHRRSAHPESLPDWIRPQLCELVTEAPDGPGWLHEIKFDGYRMHARLHHLPLWTLPMFHCNGWCFPWTITAMAGTHVCLRRVEAAAIYEAIAREGVTHLCGAPVVMNMLLNAGAGLKRSLDRRIEMMSAGAPPPAAVIEGMEALGFHITHVYGLTECYGPGVVCAWD